MSEAEKICVIRSLLPSDADRLSAAFARQGWEKPAAQFDRYLEAQERGYIRVFVAQVEGEPVGYVCLLPSAPAGPFVESAIPCISDFNVLMAYQRLGIGSELMDAVEQAAFERSPSVCLGVGFTGAMAARRGCMSSVAMCRTAAVSGTEMSPCPRWPIAGMTMIWCYT